LNREILLVCLLLVIAAKLPYTRDVYLGVAVSADARLTHARFCSNGLLCLGMTDAFRMRAERCGVIRDKTPVCGCFG
jgi:hypothetical protein